MQLATLARHIRAAGQGKSHQVIQHKKRENNRHVNIVGEASDQQAQMPSIWQSLPTLQKA